jgi:hypothetical protein
MPDITQPSRHVAEERIDRRFVEGGLLTAVCMCSRCGPGAAGTASALGTGATNAGSKHLR